MAEIAIKVENVSKRYKIRHQNGSGDGFRHALHDFATAPFRHLRKHGARDMEHEAGNNGQAENPQSAIRHSQSPIEEFWALKDVSFEVKQGEVLGIIGRNGAGKSTLLKILSRITEPTEGCVRIRGRVASLLEVGTGFHAELTGRENIFLNGSILGMTRSEIQRKFDEIVAFAEVEKFLDTPVKWYSSGMYVRLAFAVAAHLDPEILIVDEVLAVGDAAFQKKCLGKIGDVAKGGRTVLFVSHNMNAVEQLCSKALLLQKGRIANLPSDVRTVITRHLFQEDSQNGDCSEWVNRKEEFSNPWFKPLVFRLCDHEGNKLVMPVSNNTDMWVQIEAEIEATDPSLTIGYAIYAESGTLLYYSYQTDQPEPNWPRLSTGHNVLRGNVPKRLLNEGTYRIELIGGLHFQKWLFAPGENGPVIYLKIKGGLSDSPYWMASRPGKIAPVIKWLHVQG